MEIKVFNLYDDTLEKEEFEIFVKSNKENENIQNLTNYINRFELYLSRKVFVNDNNKIVEIKAEDIVMFFSDKKNNYCKANGKTYRVKNRLYEIEKIDENFIRISKNCIINLEHVEYFDKNKTGKVVVIMDDKSEEYISRRRIGSIMRVLDERSI